MIFTRNKNGKIMCNSLELDILFSGFFDIAETADELDYIFDNLVEQLNVNYSDKLDELSGEEDVFRE